MIEFRAYSASAGRPDLAPDIRAFCWLAAIRAVDTFDPTRGSLVNFAWHRVAGAARDFFRQEDPLSRGHRKAVTEGMAAPVPFVHDLDVDIAEPGALTAVEAAAEAGRLLELATDQQRTVLVMRFLEERTLDEVASRIGRTPGRVLQIQQEALARLRRLAIDGRGTASVRHDPKSDGV